MIQKVIFHESQLSSLSNIFLPSVVKELARFGSSMRFDRILKHTFGKNYQDIAELKLSFVYDVIYDSIQKKYPNEYIYKNVLANKILLGIHSLNTSFMLTEVNVSNSKADCVIVNGTLTAYEIKTKYDSLNRLSKQLDDYKKVFDKIYVITDTEKVDKLTYLRDEGVGLLRLNTNGSISTIFESGSNRENVDLACLFDILRRDEYLFIINKLTNETVDVPNSEMYRYAKDIFVSLNKGEAYEEAVKIVKKRGDSKELKEFITNAPKSLKARAIETKLTQTEKKNLLSLLELKIKDIVRGKM